MYAAERCTVDGSGRSHYDRHEDFYAAELVQSEALPRREEPPLTRR